MKPHVSVVTPSIPDRAKYLAELRASLNAQTYHDFSHHIHVDVARQGCARTVNQLAEQAEGEWLLICADDDLILPRGIETLVQHSDDADIVYAPPLVWGNASPHFFGKPPYIPSFGLIHMELWRELGGYEDVSREEDRGFWMKALAVGAKFVRADSEPTWVYRFHGGNKSYANGVAS